MMRLVHAVLSRYGPLVPRWELDEARQQAHDWWAYAEGLEGQNAWLMDLNAGLALDLAQKDYELAEMRGDA